jgi:hypothetical protein
MRSEGDLIYRELIRAYRNRVTFNSSSSEGRQGGYVYGEGKHIAFIEKYEANADFPFCFVTFNDALENLSEIIKRNHYSFIERENLRDELLSLCVFWNHYRDTWFSQYRSIQHKGLALQYFHKKILEILPQAIKDFEKEFKIAPGLFDTK